MAPPAADDGVPSASGSVDVGTAGAGAMEGAVDEAVSGSGLRRSVRPLEKMPAGSTAPEGAAPPPGNTAMAARTAAAAATSCCAVDKAGGGFRRKSFSPLGLIKELALTVERNVTIAPDAAVGKGT